MTIQLSQGSQIAIAATYGANKNMTAISNAAEAVATLEASHGIVVGDILEVSSGWGRLDKRVVRAKTVATNDVTLELIDTSSTSAYPVGGGIGTIREVLTWATVTQIEGVNAQTPQITFVPVTTLDDTIEKVIPGLEGASGMDLSLFFDLSLSWVPTVLAASDANSLSAVRITLPGGGKIYSSAYWKISRVPQLASGQAIKNSITMRYGALPISYTS